MNLAFLGETLETVPTYRPKTSDYWFDGAAAITSGSIGALVGSAFSKKKNDKGAVAGAIVGSMLGLAVVAPNLTDYRCGNNTDHPESNGAVPAYDARFRDFLIMATATAIPGGIGMVIGERLGARRAGANGKAAAIGALAGASLLGALANTAMLDLHCGSWRSSPGSTL